MQALEELQNRAQEELAATQTVEATEAWFRDYLGRNGAVTDFLRALSDLPREERPAAGRAGNELKKLLEAALHTRQEAIRQQEMELTLAAEGVDVTLPGRKPTLGKIHPSNQTLREIAHIFGQMGFQVYDSPEVETDENNFGLLNIPPGHPARDMWDTFYTTTPGVILRTHTSPGQIHAMREYCPQPIPRHSARQMLPPRGRQRPLRHDVPPGRGPRRRPQRNLQRPQGHPRQLRQPDVWRRPQPALPQKLLPLHRA